MVTQYQSLLRAREAGNVLRCHTTPHIGTYPVALHAYNVASILLLLHPEPRLELIREALWHDAGERLLGDFPAPAKWLVPGLGKLLARGEREAREKMGLGCVELTEEERWWLKGADYLEFYMWCHEQEMLGNDGLRHPMKFVLAWFLDNTGQVPDIIQRMLNVARNIGCSRMGDKP